MQLPREVPVMTLPNVILFPQAMLPLYIFEPRYRQMLGDALASHRMLSVAMQKPGRVRESPSSVAGLGLIRASVANQNGTSNLILQGIARVELTGVVQTKPYRIHTIRSLPSKVTNNVTVDALTAKLRELVSERLKRGMDLPVQVVKKLAQLNKAAESDETPAYSLEHVLEYLDALDDPDQIADIVSCTLLTVPVERQTILETVVLEARLKKLIHFLMAEIQRQREDDRL
ncbi:MAG: LON peptidase substrate-binding domain-containing protein [Verrucomicrobiota bacterium]